MDRKRLRQMAENLSDIMSDRLDGVWTEMIEQTDGTKEEKHFLYKTVRWTLINEKTGKDLLREEGHDH